MKTNHILAILALLGGITAAFTRHAEHNGLYPDWTFRTERAGGEKVRYISASHLSDLIYSKDPGILIYDVRPRDAYESYHIPRALSLVDGRASNSGTGPGIVIVYGTAEDEGLEKLSGELPGKVYVLNLCLQLSLNSKK